ncbi:MAG: peptidoglycan-binding protein [Syntrophomonas sp.]|nr:peptidoglycan-binding protein [Syntrophomonas sp.]
MSTLRSRQLFFVGVLLLLLVAVPLTAQANEYGSQNMSWGSRGTYVTQLQLDLTRLGFNTYGVDGIFGPNTYNAVVNFQKNQGLIPDGIVGPNSKAALNTKTSNITVSRSGQTDTRKYPKISKYNGIYGQFHYRELSGGSIEVDPVWTKNNIVIINLPGLNRNVQVHKLAADNFIKAFTYIKNGTATINGKRVPLLSLIKTMDGTWVTRHVNWNPAKGLSNHSWGTAIDINAANHFRYVSPAREPNDPNLILWEKAFKPAGFSWGNSYSDSMHYELLK